MKKFPLASIEKIILLQPIASGSNSFEKATLSNYHQVVFEKGAFKLDDMCVFFKENSILPSWHETFRALKIDGLVVKRKTIDGQVSEGLCLPLSILPSVIKIEIGKDVSDVLSVKLLDVELLKQKKAFARELLNKIKKAFASVTLGNGISLREARCMDDNWVDRCKECRTLDEVEDWQKVTDKDLEKYEDGTYFFCDEEGKNFYSPAYMSLRLREFIKKGRFDYYWGLLPTIDYRLFDPQDILYDILYVKRFKNLTILQTNLLKKFIALFLAKNEEELIKLFETIKDYSLEEDKEVVTEKKSKFIDKAKKDVKVVTGKKSKFINKPSNIRNKR